MEIFILPQVCVSVLPSENIFTASRLGNYPTQTEIFVTPEACVTVLRNKKIYATSRLFNCPKQ